MKLTVKRVDKINHFLLAINLSIEEHSSRIWMFPRHLYTLRVYLPKKSLQVWDFLQGTLDLFYLARMS